jgi:hypothetical protein
MIWRSRAFYPLQLNRTLKSQVGISRLFIVTGAIFLPAGSKFSPLLASAAAIVLPLPLTKGEDEGEGFFLAYVVSLEPMGCNSSTPHLNPLLVRGGEETNFTDGKHL